MKLEVQIRKKLDNILLNVSFCAQEEVFALLGASGVGKSMTLKCIAGIETPDDGRIVLDNQVLYDSSKKINIPPQKRKIGYLFQEYALFPHMTVEQNINIVVNNSNKTQELLKKFSIDDIRHKYPEEISGGQRQRVAIARMMAANPKVLLLDEPFSALDAYIKDEVIRSTEEILKDNGVITILVSHHFDEVCRLAKTVACINQGNLEEPQHIKDFYMHPKTRTAMLLQGCRNIAGIQKTAVAGQLYVPDWGIAIQGESDSSYIGISQESITIHKQLQSYCLPVSRVEINEDVFWWYLYVFCKEDSKKPLYFRLPKEDSKEELLKNITEIYVKQSGVYFLD